MSFLKEATYQPIQRQRTNGKKAVAKKRKIDHREAAPASNGLKPTR